MNVYDQLRKSMYEDAEQEQLLHTVPVRRSTTPLKHAEIATDGSCIGNPGTGGWACVMRLDNCFREMYGCEAKTTNNRMELMAVIKALNALKEPCAVTVFTDSQYVQRGITEWLSAWKERNWKTASKKPVQNQDMWRALDKARSRPRVDWKWVRGRADNCDNSRCDELAQRAAREQIASTACPSAFRVTALSTGDPTSVSAQENLEGF